MIKKIPVILSLASTLSLSAQDTFSIVAVDSTTGEVGSAGASCVDLFQYNIESGDFLGVLIPGETAINTQAYYDETNQNNATEKMQEGLSPQEAIDWLEANDVNGNAGQRQYGIASIRPDGSTESAAFTGVSCMSYANHVVGPNYSIQGNILLGQEVLDSMEAQFLRAEGDLTCRLMAALQGANMVGADSRCASNNTSSLFAYVKVALPNDEMGLPTYVYHVKTHNGDQIEPIDTLQSVINAEHVCPSSATNIEQSAHPDLYIFPNPVNQQLFLTTQELNRINKVHVYSIEGEFIQMLDVKSDQSVNVSMLDSGVYILYLEGDELFYYRKMIKQ